MMGVFVLEHFTAPTFPEPFKHGPGFPGAGAGFAAYVNIHPIAL